MTITEKESAGSSSPRLSAIIAQTSTGSIVIIAETRTLYNAYFSLLIPKEAIPIAIYRVEKTRDYTTMSNFHLRDPNLSNKARGLLSTMLSLPEDWDYTTRGLAKICKDGVDGITAQLKELEQYGYLR